MQALADYAASLGDVTQVIHTSGVSPSDTATENIIKINAVGTVNMVEAFYPALTDGGVMINFSSVAAYAMSKKFVIHFTQKNVALRGKALPHPVDLARLLSHAHAPEAH